MGKHYAEPPPRPILFDLPCHNCGYNLRTLDVTGRCPECGEPVEATLSGPPPSPPVGLSLALAVAGPVVAYVIFMLPALEQTSVDSRRSLVRLAFTAPGCGFCLEVAAFILAIRARRRGNYLSTFHRLVVTFTWCVSLFLAIAFGALAVPSCLCVVAPGPGPFT